MKIIILFLVIFLLFPNVLIARDFTFENKSERDVIFHIDQKISIVVHPESSGIIELEDDNTYLLVVRINDVFLSGVIGLNVKGSIVENNKEGHYSLTFIKKEGF